MAIFWTAVVAIFGTLSCAQDQGVSRSNPYNQYNDPRGQQPMPNYNVPNGQQQQLNPYNAQQVPNYNGAQQQSNPYGTQQQQQPSYNAQQQQPSFNAQQGAPQSYIPADFSMPRDPRTRPRPQGQPGQRQTPQDLNNPYLQRSLPGQRQHEVDFQTGGRSRGKALPEVGNKQDFHFCLGLAPGGAPHCEVVNEDIVQPEWNAVNTPEPLKMKQVESKEAVLKLYFSRTPLSDGIDDLYIQKPVATAYDPTVVEVEVVVTGKWKGGVTRVPVESVAKQQGDNLQMLGLVFNCIKTGQSRILLQTRMIAALPGNTHQRKEVNVVFVKYCTVEDVKVQTAVGSATGSEDGKAQPAEVVDKRNWLPNFHIGTSKDAKDVVRDGQTREGFRGGKEGFVIEEDVSTTSFYLTVPKGIEIRQPVVRVMRPEMLDVRKSFMRSGPEQQRLNLLFKCRQQGQVRVTVMMLLKQPAGRRVVFSLNKICAAPGKDLGASKVEQEKERISGLMVPGFNIGTKKGNSNVALNGMVKDKFKLASDPTQAKKIERHTYHKDTTILKFYFTSEEPVGLKKPIVTELVSEGDEPHMKPEFEVNLITLAVFSKTKAWMTTLRFNCYREGVGELVVAFPLKDGTIEAVVRKDCAEGEEPENDVTKLPIPGFHVGLSSDVANVVQDGLALDSWSSELSGYKYQMEADQLYTTFFVFVSENDEDESLVPSVNFTAPEVITSAEVTNLEITGPASDGAVLDSKRRSTRISVTYHCLKEATITIAVVLPMVPYDGQGPQQIKDVKFEFVKTCDPSDPSKSVVGLGGVGITGFFVGTTPEADDIVYNGFPRKSYFGQRALEVPKWDDVIVGYDKAISKVYLSYIVPPFFSEYEVGKGVAFQAPIVVSDSRVCKAKLSGPAAQGGILTVKLNTGLDEETEADLEEEQETEKGDSDESLPPHVLELDINYDCFYEGTAAISVIVPIVPHGTITFTIPKECKGRKPPKGVTVPGLTIETAIGKTDVMKDGLPMEQFSHFNTDNFGSYRTSGESTKFYISSRVMANIQAMEPLVFAHRPISNPQIDHQMHVVAGTNEAMMDSIIIGKQPKEITITYNCLMIDETAITMIIPFPNGQRVSFTWTHDCGAGLDEFHGFPEELGDEASYFDEDDYDEYDEYGYELEDIEDQGNAYGGDLWDNMEINYMPDLHEDCEKCTGTLSIGTLPDLPANVVDRGMALPKYALPLKSEKDPLYTIIDRNTPRTSFYITATATSNRGTHQEFFPPTVITGKSKTVGEIVRPVISGPSAGGGDAQVSKELTKLRIDVEFNCRKTGVVPVIVTVPLKPANRGFVTWRIMKVCGKFERVEAFYWTANRIFVTIASSLAVILCCAMAFLLRRLQQGKSISYSALSTFESDTPSSKMERVVHHHIELMPNNPDDSD